MVSTPPPSGRSRRGARVLLGAALAWVVALHGSLIWLEATAGVSGPRLLWGDEVRYQGEADQRLRGETPEPNLLWPPFYSRFLAWVEGSGAWAGLPPRVAVSLAQTLLLVLSAALGAAVARELGARPGAARAVGFLLLGFPPLAAYAHYLWPEVLHLTLALGAVWVLFRRRESLLWMPVLGVLLGLALLTKSLLGPVLPLMLAPVVGAGPWRQRWLRLAVVLLALGGTLAPTLMHHHGTTGRWMIADSSSFNAWLGLNDRSRKSYEDGVTEKVYQRYLESGRTFTERDAAMRHRITSLVDRVGVRALLRVQLERQYFRLLDKDSILTDQLPGGVVHQRGGGYREPPPALAGALRAVSYGLHAWILAASALVLVLVVFPELVPTRLQGARSRLPFLRGGAALGLALSPRQRRWWVGLGMFLAYNLAIFLVLHVKSRYRIQVLPVLFLLTAVGTEAAVRAFDGEAPNLSRASPWLWGLGAAGAALLLFLAFAGPWLGPL